jgi:hypothetical protein
MCSKPIHFKEEYYALEDPNFTGNKDKLYHERCIDDICPGYKPLLVKRVQLSEEDTVQFVGCFGNAIPTETMEEIGFMMEQIAESQEHSEERLAFEMALEGDDSMFYEVRHYQNVITHQNSDGESDEIDDNAEAFGSGRPWCKSRCLIGLVIYFAAMYLTRINWSSMMPDHAQEVTGLNYTDEPNIPQMKKEVPLFSDKCYLDDANFDECYAAQLVSDDRVTPAVVPE